MCNKGIWFHIICWTLYWAEIVDRFVTWNYNHSSGMLSSSFSGTFTAFCHSHDFCSSFLYFSCIFYCFEVLFHISESILFSKRGNCSSTEYVLASKQLFCIFVNFSLILSRKVKVNIWHLISVKSHKYFKWYGMSIFYVFCATFRTVFVRIVNSASFFVHKFCMLTFRTSVVRIKPIYFSNSHKIGNYWRADWTTWTYKVSCVNWSLDKFLCCKIKDGKSIIYYCVKFLFNSFF